MQSWPETQIPHLPGTSVPLCLYDSADQNVHPVTESGMYVCGITPYDSTHLGHAATYLAFDLINRMLRDQGATVRYVQNVTDVDDPLFERAHRDGVDWEELGTDQLNLFRSDMTALSVIPPTDLVGVKDGIHEVIDLVSVLLDTGAAYVVDDSDYPDIYASITATKHFGYESHYDRPTMEKFFAQRGGDPQRPGKHDPLDALIWRAHRPGEPQWDAPFGAGRPGWHVECAAFAAHRLGCHFAIQGGGSDLVFPHHEFSAAHVEAAYGCSRMADHYVHTGMIALDGVKMSKSLGNLVFVSDLLAAQHDPSAIRLAVFAGHYRSDRDWSASLLDAAEERLSLWRRGVAKASSRDNAEMVVQILRERLADDLDTPGALDSVDRWAHQVLDEYSDDSAPSETHGDSQTGGELMSCALDALLGVKTL